MYFAAPLDRAVAGWACDFWRYVDRSLIAVDATRTDPRERLEAITRALTDLHIRWDESHVGAGRDTNPTLQWMRTPKTVRTDKKATCAEMVALAAAACANAGLRVWAAFGESPNQSRHAWLIVDVRSADIKDYGPATGYRMPEESFRSWKQRPNPRHEISERIEDASRLHRWIAAGNGFEVVDVTGCCEGYEASDATELFAAFPTVSLCDVWWWWTAEWVYGQRFVGPRLAAPSGRLLVTSAGETFVATREAGGPAVRQDDNRVAEGIVALSPDGRIAAAATATTIETVFVRQYPLDEAGATTPWLSGTLGECGSEAEVLAVTRRGEIDAVAVVADATTTWLAELDANGEVRYERVADEVASAAVIVQGRVWRLVEGRLVGPDAPRFGDQYEVIDVDLAGPIGSEVLAALVAYGERQQVVAIVDPLGVAYRPEPVVLGEPATSVSVVRHLAGDPPDRIEVATGGRRLGTPIVMPGSVGADA